MKDLFSLHGRVALVTGASRGLGKALAQALARAGATVVLAARDEERLAAVAEEIRDSGGEAHLEAFDLTDEREVTAVVPRIIQRCGHLDILLNNAGLCIWGEFLNSSTEAWRRTLETNLTAPYLLARAAAATMVAQQWGRIINIGSYVSVLGRERLQAYVASKHGLAGLTKSLLASLAATASPATRLHPASS